MNVTPDLDARFREAALRERLVDVRFDVVDSPIGDLFVAATERGLCRLSFWPEGMEESLAHTFGPRVLRMPLDLRVAPFHAEVLAVFFQFPNGRTETYGALAAKVGRPKAARAVGT